MRRTVATLLVVASPVLMAVPADAGDTRVTPRPAAVAAPTVPDSLAAPAAPAPVAVTPAPVPTPVAVTPAPVPTPVAVTPATPAPARVAPAVRPVVRAVPAKKTPIVADADDAAYAARLQAELCQARAVFCGLDRGGRYPAG